MIRRADEEAQGPKLLAEFDPNAKPLPKPQHATYAPFRKPAWKIHASIGPAKAAVATHRWVVRYEYLSSLVGAAHWHEVERKEGE